MSQNGPMPYCKTGAESEGNNRKCAAECDYRKSCCEHRIFLAKESGSKWLSYHHNASRNEALKKSESKSIK